MAIVKSKLVHMYYMSKYRNIEGIHESNGWEYSGRALAQAKVIAHMPLIAFQQILQDFECDAWNNI